MEKGTSREKRMKTELFCNGGQGFILDFSWGGDFPGVPPSVCNLADISYQDN